MPRVPGVNAWARQNDTLSGDPNMPQKQPGFSRRDALKAMAILSTGSVAASSQESAPADTMRLSNSPVPTPKWIRGTPSSPMPPTRSSRR